jgi:hypothetical protein
MCIFIRELGQTSPLKSKKARIGGLFCKAGVSDRVRLLAYSHSIVNKTFLSFIFNGLFSC